MVFLGVCALFLVLGCLAVFYPSPLYAAFLLVLWLVVLAAIYLYLNFEFLAMLQVLVYAGAIMVLFIFTIMLLDTREVRDSFEINWLNIFSIPFFLAVFFMLFPILKNWVPTKTQPDFQLEDVTSGLIQTKLGEYFYSQMFLVFQALGVIIFIGVMAALLITPALQKKS